MNAIEITVKDDLMQRQVYNNYVDENGAVDKSYLGCVRYYCIRYGKDNCTHRTTPLRISLTGLQTVKVIMLCVLKNGVS